MTWKNLPKFVHMHEFFKKDLSKHDNPMEEVSPEVANLVSSVYYRGESSTYHRPLLDIDMNCAVLPSTTPGHNHLFIDKLLTEEQYGKLLEVLVEVGIVQKGILDLQWKQDGQTALRLPHIKKQPKDSSSAGTSNKIEWVQPQGENTVLAEWETELLGINVNTMPFDASEDAVANDASEKPINPKDYAEAIEPAVAQFKMLAQTAAETGQSLSEVVNAWKKFLE